MLKINDKNKLRLIEQNVSQTEVLPTAIMFFSSTVKVT